MLFFYQKVFFKTFIAYLMAYFCCYSCGVNLDVSDFLQENFVLFLTFATGHKINFLEDLGLVFALNRDDDDGDC